MTDLNLANLQFDITGPSGVKVELSSGVDISQLIPTRQLLSFYTDRYVNYLDIIDMEDQLKSTWTGILNNTGEYPVNVGCL